jgi:hypothetical protein
LGFHLEKLGERIPNLASGYIKHSYWIIVHLVR